MSKTGEVTEVLDLQVIPLSNILIVYVRDFKKGVRSFNIFSL